MQLLKQEKFNKKLSESFEYKFDLGKEGLCIIEIRARARSEKQIGQSETDDDDLRIEIDGRKFPKLNNQEKYFDSAASFSGGKLKNLKKTIYFLINLSKGNHKLKFVPDRNPFLEDISIKLIGDKISDINLDIKNQAENGDRRPWITFALVDLPLKSITARVTAKWRLRDSDDVKLIVDNEIQKNKNSLLHKNWLWAGSIFKKLFQNETQTKTIETNLVKGPHYIEFWADRRPLLHNVIFDFGLLLSEQFKKGRIALYKDIVSISKVAQLRSEADHTKDNIIKALEDATKLIILEERVVGTLVSPLSNIWHKVRVGDQEGFVLSSLIEIIGQDREIIVNKIRRKATELGADPDLMIALAGCESRYKPYAVSEDNARGIMQITDIAIQQVAKGGFFVQDPFNPDQNIEGGIRYFLWILNSFYKNTTQAIEKTIAAYNWKIKRISELFGNGPINLDQLPEETARHVLCVIQNAKKKSWKNIVWPMIILVVALAGSFMMAQFFKDTDKLFANAITIPTANSYSSFFPCPRLSAKKETVELIDQNCKTVRVFTPSDLQAEKFLSWSKEDPFNFVFYNDISGMPDAEQNQDGYIYFLLSTSLLCGSSGCGYVLYEYNTLNDKIRVVETEIDSVARTLLSPNGKKIAIASASFNDICEANSYLRIIDLVSQDKQTIRNFEDHELPLTHIRNLQWLSDNVLTFSTLHNKDCDPVTSTLTREKEFTYDIFRNTISSRLIREYEIQL